MHTIMVKSGRARGGRRNELEELWGAQEEEQVAEADAQQALAVAYDTLQEDDAEEVAKAPTPATLDGEPGSLMELLLGALDGFDIQHAVFATHLAPEIIAPPVYRPVCLGDDTVVDVDELFEDEFGT